MAEGFANKYSSYKAFSAGTKKTNLDPLAVKVMSEIDIDISQHFSKTFNDLFDKFVSDDDTTHGIFLVQKHSWLPYDSLPLVVTTLYILCVLLY